MSSNGLIRYKNKFVADLHWVLASANMVEGKYIENDPFQWQFLFSENRWVEIQHWLSELDDSPNKLVQFLSSKPTSKRLGKYFENLLLFAFSNLEEVEQVVHSLQVKRSKDTTLGEIDFLLQRSSNSSWIHLEVAVKFYLAIENNGITQFIGPNAKDRLDLKLDRLYQRQIELGSIAEGNDMLSQLGIDNYEKQLVVKGFLFYNLLHPITLDPPSYINPYSQKGWWSYFHEYPFEKHSTKSFVLLNKLDWLSGNIEANEAITSLDIKMKIERKELTLPILLAEVEIENGEWTETSRGFLVDKNWPRK